MTPRRPRVLLLLHGLGRGGAEWSVVRLAAGLLARGCEVRVHAWKIGGPLLGELEAAGVAACAPSTPPLGLARLRVPAALARVAREWRADLVHAHLSDAATLGVAVQTLTGIPCVVTHHSPDLVDTVGAPGSLYRRLRLRLLVSSARRAARNLAVSDAVREALVGAGACSAGEVERVHNAITSPTESQLAAARAERRERAAGQGPLRLAFVGRLAPSKGVATLLAALAQARARGARCELVVVGDGPEAAPCAQLADGLGLAEAVTWVGATSDVASHLARADVYASASTIEGEPLAVLEAQSWELPVVATDITGHRPLVAEAGLLVPVGNVAAMAEAMLSLAADAARREALGRRGRRNSEGRSPAAVADRHLEIYERVLSGRRAPRGLQAGSASG